jgi:TatD DNase family protein
MKIKGIFDTHCHLSDPLLKPQVIKVLEAAKSANISHICNVAYNQQTIKTVMFQSYKYFQLYPAIGIHPNCVSELEEEKISILELEKFILTGKVKAIGEIGLDYYRKQTTPLLQKKWFIEQLKLAKKYQLPVLVHVRDA